MAMKKQGISIRIIASDKKFDMPLMNELENNFDMVKVPLKGAHLSNWLHDKFCIIDFEFVMHGSYTGVNRYICANTQFIIEFKLKMI